jgi:hypothetical protein
MIPFWDDRKQNRKFPKFISQPSFIEQDDIPFESRQANQIFHECKKLNFGPSPKVSHCHMTDFYDSG